MILGTAWNRRQSLFFAKIKHTDWVDRLNCVLQCKSILQRLTDLFFYSFDLRFIFLLNLFMNLLSDKICRSYIARCSTLEHNSYVKCFYALVLLWFLFLENNEFISRNYNVFRMRCNYFFI